VDSQTLDLSAKEKILNETISLLEAFFKAELLTQLDLSAILAHETKTHSQVS